MKAAEDRMLFDQSERDDDAAAMERRLAVDLEDARLAVLEIRATLEPDRLSLKDLEVEIEIVKNLFGRGQILLVNSPMPLNTCLPKTSRSLGSIRWSHHMKRATKGNTMIA